MAATTKKPAASKKLAYMTPSLSLLLKIGNIAVHADEMLSSDGHHFDKIALAQNLNDPEVKQWIKDMGPLLPVKRQ